jgi:hypothetical protein
MTLDQSDSGFEFMFNSIRLAKTSQPRKSETEEILPREIGSCGGPFLTSPLGANFDPRGEVEVIPWG